MKRRAFLSATAAMGALPARADVVVEPAPDRAAEVRALLGRQAAQWTAGDLDGFCAHYADDAIFVSPSGRTDGREAVAARYKKKYGGDKTGMGALSLEVLHVVADERAASVAMIWRLTWPKKPAAQGFSVVGLERQPGKSGVAWKIVHDASM